MFDDPDHCSADQKIHGDEAAKQAGKHKLQDGAKK